MKLFPKKRYCTVGIIFLLNCATYSNKTITDQGSNPGKIETYEILNHSGVWNREEIAAIQQYFADRNIGALVSKDSKKQHCKIEITHKGPVGAGIEFLTGLSLGIIPTASFAYPSHEIQIFHIDGDTIRRQAIYELRFWTLNWLPFALPAWVLPHDNKYRLKKEIYKIMESFQKPLEP